MSETLLQKQNKQREALLRHREKLLKQMSEHKTDAIVSEFNAVNQMLSEVEANIRSTSPDQRFELLSKTEPKNETDKLAVLKTLSEAQLALILKSDNEAQAIWSQCIQAEQDKEKCTLEQAMKQATKEYPHIYEAVRIGLKRFQAKHKAVSKSNKFTAIWQAVKAKLNCSNENAMKKAIELFPELDS